MERIPAPNHSKINFSRVSRSGAKGRKTNRMEKEGEFKQVYFWKQLWVFAAMDVVSTYGRFAEGVGGGADGDGVRKVWQS